MEVDEYPVVLVVGAESETGQVVLRPFRELKLRGLKFTGKFCLTCIVHRKLVTSGYPCVVLKSGDNEESLGALAQ